MRSSATNLAALLLVLVPALAVQAQSTLYWTNPAAGTVERMTLPNGPSEEVLAAVVQEPRAISVDIDAGKIYWIDFNTVRRSDLDGTNIEDLAKTQNPSAMALDATSGWIYWAGDYALQRMRLDGSSRAVLVDTAYTGGLAVDSEEGKLYWTSGGCWGGDGRVYRANVTGLNVETFASGQDCPRELALDPARRRLYWSDGSGVMSALLEGSSIMGLAANTQFDHVLPEHKGGSIGHIALDVEQGRLYFSIQGTVYRHLGRRVVDMLPVESDLGLGGFAVAGRDLYWTDFEKGVIQRLNLDSNESLPMIRSDVLNPRHMALDPAEEKIYWTESYWIKRADLDGRNVERLVGPTFYMAITDLALDPVNQKLYWSTWNGWGPHHDGGVYRSNLDGTEIDSLYFGGVFALALDPDHGKMFIGDGYRDDWFNIKEANLNGSYAKDLTYGEPFASVTAMALDKTTGTLYYHQRDTTNWGLGHLLRTAVYGGQYLYPPEVLNYAPYRLGGLTLDLLDQKMYWTENDVNDQKGNARIRRADLSGQGIEDVVAVDDADFADIAIQSENQSATSVSSETSTDFKLFSAYPNPFNPSTTIRYALASTQRVTIKVRDALGRLVQVLVDEIRPAGSHSVQWIADSNTPSGTYFYTLETGHGAVTRSMVLLR